MVAIERNVSYAPAMPRTREVLVIDDSRADAVMLEHLLTESGDVKVALAASGAQAIEWLEAQPGVPDLIILDLNMPGMSGHEVLARLRFVPRYTIVPVIVLTTSDAPEDVTKCYETGCNAFLTKPATLEESQEMIEWLKAFWMRLAVLPND